MFVSASISSVSRKGIDCVSEFGLSKFEVILYHDFEFSVLSLRSLASFSLYFYFASRISVVTAFRFCLNFIHVVALFLRLAILNNLFL